MSNTNACRPGRAGQTVWGIHVCSGYLEDAVKGSCSVVGSFWGRNRGVMVAHDLYPWALQGSSEAPGHRDGPSCWPQECVVVPDPFQRRLEAAATPASAQTTILALTSGEIRTSHVSSYCIACRNMTALRRHLFYEKAYTVILHWSASVDTSLAHTFGNCLSLSALKVGPGGGPSLRSCTMHAISERLSLFPPVSNILHLMYRTFLAILHRQAAASCDKAAHA